MKGQISWVNELAVKDDRLGATYRSLWGGFSRF